MEVLRSWYRYYQSSYVTITYYIVVAQSAWKDQSADERRTQVLYLVGAKLVATPFSVCSTN